MTPDDLRAWLKIMGFNQTQAAKALRVNRSTIGHWLSGYNPIPPMAESAMQDKLVLKRILKETRK